MKYLKIILLFFAASFLTFTACKKNKIGVETLIVGTWDVSKIINDQYIDGVKTIRTTTTSFTNLDYIEFKSNGTVIFSSSGGNQKATYALTADGKTITVVYEGGVSKELFDVRSLSVQQLVIHQLLPAVTMQNKIYKTALEGTYIKR